MSFNNFVVVILSQNLLMVHFENFVTPNIANNTIILAIKDIVSNNREL